MNKGNEVKQGMRHDDMQGIIHDDLSLDGKDLEEVKCFRYLEMEPLGLKRVIG